MSIGGLLRRWLKDRRIPAQTGPWPGRCLVARSGCRSMGSAFCGAEFRNASDQPFRSPSCSGQARAPRAGLPVFFLPRAVRCDRRSCAETDVAARSAIDLCLTRTDIEIGQELRSKGGAECGFLNCWSCRGLFCRWRGASKTTASARLRGRLSGQSRPTRWIATSQPALQSARPAVRSATTRAFATDLTAPRALAPAGQLSDEAIGALRPGGLCFVSGRASALRPRTGRDWNVQ